MYGSFSWKLARKWAQGVLMEICMFIYASNAVGKSQEVLYWLVKKYGKCWNPTGNRNYFPTTFTLLNAAAVPPSLFLGSGSMATLSPLGSSVPGLRQGGLWLPLLCPASPWHLGITPQGLTRCFWVGRQGYFFQTPVGIFGMSKTKYFPLIVWEGKLSKPCVHLCGCLIKSNS